VNSAAAINIKTGANSGFRMTRDGGTSQFPDSDEEPESIYARSMLQQVHDQVFGPRPALVIIADDPDYVWPFGQIREKRRFGRTHDQVIDRLKS